MAVPVPAPNQGMQATAYSVRSAPASGARLKRGVIRTDRACGVGDRTLVADDLWARRGDVVIAWRILHQFGWLAPCALAISLIITPGLAADDAQEAWAALIKGGHVALIRHGNAPPGYGGDPPGFTIDDCKTQRNLDERGREQARVLGEAFRNHGVRVDRILSSPWCRCLETAHLMAVGPVEQSWALVPDREPTAPVRLLEFTGDGVRLARPGHARARDARLYRAGAARIAAEPGRDCGAQTRAR